MGGKFEFVAQLSYYYCTLPVKPKFKKCFISYKYFEIFLMSMKFNLYFRHEKSIRWVLSKICHLSNIPDFKENQLYFLKKKTLIFKAGYILSYVWGSRILSSYSYCNPLMNWSELELLLWLTAWKSLNSPRS